MRKPCLFLPLLLTANTAAAQIGWDAYSHSFFVLVCKPIYEYDELLAAYGFLRCHQSHLVNRQYIKSWKKEFGDSLLLTNGTEVPISRGKKEAIKRALNLL